MEIITGIFSENFWWIAPILMSITVVFTGAINNTFNITNAVIKQVISWIIGSLLSVGSWAIKLITFGEPIWLGVIMLCIVVGLSSNGIYDIPSIKKWIDNTFKRRVTIED